MGGLLEKHSSQIKVSRRTSVTYLNQTPTFEWCVLRCGSKNGHQNYMCLSEVGFCALNLFTIIGSIVRIIGGTHMIILGGRDFLP